MRTQLTDTPHRSLGAAEGEEDAVWAELSGRLLGESWR